MTKNLYIKDEVVLCTYIARYGKKEIDEIDIQKITNRSVASIKMKIQNITSMLDEEGFDTSPNISKLTGKPQGLKGRKTNWDIVSNLTKLTKNDFLVKCENIISNQVKTI
ncbi:hypothetical protein [Tenacibaculum piscium]|uniref:hypothetical protein n=1 Tax=Tenacibaculum piscium TaxID=1458515 RepID=UPI001F2C2D3A|nr:hypothetical protein [Tenacibaculum piscium]